MAKKHVTMLLIRGDEEVVDAFKHVISVALTEEEDMRHRAGQVNLDDWYFTSTLEAEDPTPEEVAQREFEFGWGDEA